MQPKLPLIALLFAVILTLAFLPACTKKETPSEPAVETSEEDEAAKQARLEEERRKKEAEAEKWRAAKIKFTYEDIHFKKGSYALSPEAQDILMRKAQWLRDHPYVTTIIEGHTDEAGTKEYNIALGDRRAGEAKSFLIKQGIATERLIAVSYGNDKPIDPKRTEDARKKNRRVHFVIE
jgi:peptidoglycan-associated lipoprotein